MTGPNYPTLERTSAEVGDVVLDTSVLMDCMFRERPGHDRAIRLARVLQSEGNAVFIPAHFYYEFVSAVLCELRVREKPLTMGELKGKIPFRTFVVTIDERFAIDHLVSPFAAGRMINLKGGDMIFAALALGQAIPLITEDRKMLSEVRRLGGGGFTIDEYLGQIVAFHGDDAAATKVPEA